MNTNERKLKTAKLKAEELTLILLLIVIELSFRIRVYLRSFAANIVRSLCLSASAVK
jgi:hypothetical protein